jgi:HEAT repeat protein
MAAFEINDLEAVRKELADPDFAKKLAAYNISEMKKQAFQKLDKLTKSATYKDESIRRTFSAKAQDVCRWVVSITDCF